MKAIEKSRRWYENILLPELKKHFPEELCRMAVGVAGRGSECFGFDDEVSGDHDNLTGVSIWLTDEDERTFGLALGRLYREVHRRSFPEKGHKSQLGFAEHGVDTVSGFFRRHLGISGAPESCRQWLDIPEYALAEAVDGEIFADGPGIFSAIREKIMYGMPEDVRLKKIAGHLVMMAQSGQYNFERCLKHGETAAAEIALGEFVRHAVSLAFLLNFRFAPYYKWMFRGMRQLPQLGFAAEKLAALLVEKQNIQPRLTLIEEIASDFIRVIQEQNLSNAAGNYLEPHAFAVLRGIGDQQLRAMHIMDF